MIWHYIDIKINFAQHPELYSGRSSSRLSALLFFHCLSDDVEIINVTQAVKTPSNLHGSSSTKPSITANSKQAPRSRCCLVGSDTNSNK